MSIFGAPFRLAGSVVKSAGEVVKSTGRFVSELGGSDSPPPNPDPVRSKQDDCSSHHHYHSIEEANLRRERLKIEAEALQAKQKRERQEEIDHRLEEGRNAFERSDYPVALTEFERVLTLSPGHHEAKEGVKKSYKLIADAYVLKGSFFEALSAYVKAGFDPGIQDVMKRFFAKAVDSEEVADSKGSSLKEVEEALRIYVDINETFSKLEKKLKGNYSLENLSLQRKSIQKKIEQAKSTIQTLEANDLVLKADQQMDHFQTIYEGGKHTKAALEAFKKHLEEIDLLYIQARSKNRTCPTPNWPRLTDFSKAIDTQLAECEKEEILHAMKKCITFLIESSLKDEEQLDAIVKHCDKWLSHSQKVIRYPEIDKDQMRQRKEIVEEVSRTARRSQLYLKNPSMFLCPLIDEVIHEFDENGELSEKNRKSLVANFNQIFADHKNLRELLIALTPAGYQQLKMNMKYHLSKRIVKNSCLGGCFSKGVVEYRLNSQIPIRAEDLSYWMKEMNPECFINDMADRFQAGSRQTEEDCVEGAGEEGMQKVSLLRPPPTVPDYTSYS